MAAAVQAAGVEAVEAVEVADLVVGAVLRKASQPTPIAKPVVLACVSFTVAYGALHQAQSLRKTKFVA